MPAARCVVDLVSCCLRTADGAALPTREAVARYGLAGLYQAALSALAWALDDLGLLAGTAADAAPDASPDVPGEA